MCDCVNVNIQPTTSVSANACDERLEQIATATCSSMATPLSFSTLVETTLTGYRKTLAWTRYEPKTTEFTVTSYMIPNCKPAAQTFASTSARASIVCV